MIRTARAQTDRTNEKLSFLSQRRDIVFVSSVYGGTVSMKRREMNTGRTVGVGGPGFLARCGLGLVPLNDGLPVKGCVSMEKTRYIPIALDLLHP